MTATVRFFVWGALPLGGLAGGLLGQKLGLRPAIAIATTAMMLSSLWIFLSPLPKLDSIPTAVD